jgi:hemerythrin-like domain-containing protein
MNRACFSNRISSNRSKERNLNILDIIKQEHREVSALLDQAEKLEPDDRKMKTLAVEVEQKLSTHMAIEERLLYSRLKSESEDDDVVDVYEGYTEHDVAKHLIELLQNGRPSAEKFKAEFQVLSEAVKHHVSEEESTIFGIAKKQLNREELETLGKKWEAAKRRAEKDLNG